MPARRASLAPSVRSAPGCSSGAAGPGAVVCICGSRMEPIAYLPPAGVVTALVLYRCAKCGRREWGNEGASARLAPLETCSDLPNLALRHPVTSGWASCGLRLRGWL
jgi:hypothetical protein